MIQRQTYLMIMDNSGAKTVQCISILGGFKKKIARIGDIIVVSVKSLRVKNKSKVKIKKGEVFRALVVKTKNVKKKKDGTTLKFTVNSGVLLNKQNKPVATRILNSIPKEFRYHKFMKITSLASAIL